MYKRILVPVDLQHVEQVDQALICAADLSKHWQATLCLVAVHGTTPDGVAAGPGAFAAELNMFAREQATRFDIAEIDSRVIQSVDAAAELDQRLQQAIEEEQVDLVIMASHLPGLADRLRLRSSNAAQLLRRSSVSIMVVR